MNRKEERMMPISTDNPVDIPRRFFHLLGDEKYPQVWELMTKESQTRIASVLLRGLHTVGYQFSLDLMQRFLKHNQSPWAEAYWLEFRKSLKTVEWLKLTYSTLATSKDRAVIETQPYKILLTVLKEDGQWRFGYMESFAPRD